MVIHEGKYATKNFKLYLTENGATKIKSPWHDIPLFADTTSSSSNSDSTLVNFIVEIPMYSTAKMEMMKDVLDNPIMQDTKDNAPRYYSYGVPFFNYGLLPQTWEDPTIADATTGAKGIIIF